MAMIGEESRQKKIMGNKKWFDVGKEVTVKQMIGK